MLEVILYRVTPDGLLDLSERAFLSLDRLARFFASESGRPWHWAEVTVEGRRRSRRYSAEELRATLAPTIPSPPQPGDRQA